MVSLRTQAVWFYNAYLKSGEAESQVVVYWGSQKSQFYNSMMKLWTFLKRQLLQSSAEWGKKLESHVIRRWHYRWIGSSRNKKVCRTSYCLLVRTSHAGHQTKTPTYKVMFMFYLSLICIPLRAVQKSVLSGSTPIDTHVGFISVTSQSSLIDN